ncbi:hypothetical protein GCM10010193_33430 [Kitasatospora atroaurantiaca]|uniref:AAA ATPase-like protein n=1 Tax=Kitasatospora atroaurantiaca TaxID=285545 RepID=A0A561ENM5_9ACTN|nr:hypothetical protein [Kitasatospora atroaurantiaca]TWE17200.1 hypothetical protein FB465_2208 [Kitasatospora atroaurantiaca]
MTPPVDWLHGAIDDLRHGADLGSLLLDGFTPADRETLRRCAAVTRFNRALYDALLQVPGGAGLHALEQRGALTEDQQDGTLRIADHLRGPSWESWWPAGDRGTEFPEPLRAFAAELAAHYRDREPDQVEEIRQLLRCDEPEALRCFRAAFDRADRALDLARCQDLLAVLDDPHASRAASPALLELRTAARVRLQSRALWRTAHQQSAHYFSRPRAEEPLRALLTDSGAKVLQLHAPGGAGKTSLLRWFAARHCQERDTPVPCAWIDFDTADPLTAAAHPWLLLLEAATQFDRQLPGEPFATLLLEYGPLAPALARNAGPSSLDRLDGLADPASLGRRITARFTATLAEALTGLGVPAVLLLDTFEELTLRAAPDSAALPRLLEQVQCEVPELRLVFSGRYDLAEPLPESPNSPEASGAGVERLPGFARLFPDAARAKVSPFSACEADGYLLARGIHDHRLRGAVISVSGGLPFTLALFADIATTLTPQQIREAPGPKLLYAIDRVLERIDDDRVRWVLRYGVLPRRLSLRFVREVMYPHLVRGIRGESDADDPDQDARRVLRKPILQKARPGLSDEGTELESLWRELTAYAGSSSWVSVDPLHPEELIFHHNVRAPLRRLLAVHPVHRLLHRDAADHFRALAETEPAEWVRWTSEELYHRFQLGEDEGIAAWHGARKRSADRPDRLGELARDLLGPDYRPEHADRADRADATGVLPEVVRAQAQLLTAQAALDNPAGISSSQWVRVHQGLVRARGGLKRVIAPVEGGFAELVRADTSAWANALVDVLLRLGDLPAAAEEATAALRQFAGRLRPQEEAAIRVRRASSLLRLCRPDEAEEDFRTAYNALARTDSRAAAGIAGTAAEALLDSGQIRLAAGWLPEITEADDGAGTDQVRTHDRLLLSLGRPGDQLDDGWDPRDPWSALAAARSLLALHRPVAAHQALAAAEAAIVHEETSRSSETWEADRSWEVARTTVTSEVQAMLRDAGAALGEWAPLMVQEVSDQELAAHLVGAVRALVHAGGSLTDAERLLDRAGRLGGWNGFEEWTAENADWRLLWWQVHLEMQRLRLPGLDDLYEAMEFAAAQDPDLALRTLIGLAILDPPAGADFVLQDLPAVLAAFPTRESVLIRLGDLTRCARPWDLPEDQAAAILRECLKGPLDLAEWSSSDQSAALGLHLVELLRLLGRPIEAMALLRSCSERLAPHEPFVWLHWARAMRRLGSPAPVPPWVPGLLSAEYAAYPTLRAEAAIGLARARFASGQYREARELAASAWRLVGGPADAVADRLSVDCLELLVRLEDADRGGLPAPVEDPDDALSEHLIALGLALPASPVSRWPAIGLGGSGAAVGGPNREVAFQYRLPPVAARRFVRPARAVPEIRAELDLDGRSQRLELTLSARPPSFVGATRAIGTELPGWLWTDGQTELLPMGLLQEAVNRPLEWATEAGELLRTLAAPQDLRLPGDLEGEEQIDVRLDLSASELWPVPWEWIWSVRPPFGDRPPRRLYRSGDERLRERHLALLSRRVWDSSGPPDRALQPRLLARLVAEKAAEARSDRPLRVVMLRPLQKGRNPSSERNLPETAYTSSGRYSVEIGARADMHRPHDRDLLHVQGSFVEYRGAIALDLHDGLPPVLPEELAPRIPPKSLWPLLVLEALRPASSSEWTRQVLLRNAFAHKVLEQGTLPVVLAVGPFQDQSEHRRVLADALADGRRPGEAAAMVTRATVRQFGRGVVVVGLLALPALFSHLPMDCLLPLGTDLPPVGTDLPPVGTDLPPVGTDL